MRVIAGRFKGAALAAPKSQTVRPTSDRLRESLFNILVHGYGDPVTDTRVLDLFSGTGALGIEALSRGARYCLFVDDSTEGRALIRRNTETLGLTGATKIWRRDATKLGPVGTLQPFPLAFLDPPYGRGLGEAALASALAGGWLTPGALCVLEEEAAAEITLPDGVELIERRDQGESALHFLRVAS